MRYRMQGVACPNPVLDSFFFENHWLLTVYTFALLSHARAIPSVLNMYVY